MSSEPLKPSSSAALRFDKGSWNCSSSAHSYLTLSMLVSDDVCPVRTTSHNIGPAADHMIPFIHLPGQRMHTARTAPRSKARHPCPAFPLRWRIVTQRHWHGRQSRLCNCPFHLSNSSHIDLAMVFDDGASVLERTDCSRGSVDVARDAVRLRARCM